MGIVRLSGRDGVRLSADACERAGTRGLSEACGVGHAPEVGSLSWVDVVDNERARQSTTDRPQVRRDSLPKDETQVAS